MSTSQKQAGTYPFGCRFFSVAAPDPKERAERYREVSERLWQLAQRPGVSFESRRHLGVIADQFEQMAKRIEAEAD